PMSALPPKADIGTQPRNVRFVPKEPKEMSALCQKQTFRPLLDIIVGGQGCSSSWSITHETSPQTISASCSRRCCIAGAATHRIGAGLSNPTGTLDRRVSAGRPERHHRAPHGRPIISALAPAVCRREPAGRVEQCCNGDGRKVSARRLY